MSNEMAGKRAWSAAVEVSRQDMRRGNPYDLAKHAFFRDVLLRLEQTRETAAIRYEFASHEEARLYKGYASSNARKELGLATTRSKLRQGSNGTWHVYFARGPKWHKV